MSKLLICFNTVFRSIYFHSHFGPETGMLQAQRQLSIIQGRKAGGHKDNPEKEAAKETQNICKLDNKNIFGTFTFGITTSFRKNNKKSPKDPCKWLSEGSRDSLSRVEQSKSRLVPSGARHC